jgi:hypothetical protein
VIIILISLRSFTHPSFTDLQAEIGRLVSTLRVNLGPKPRRIKHLMGYRAGLEQARLSVTGLILHERIELKENRGIVTRQYAERLISDAVLYGDTHKVPAASVIREIVVSGNTKGGVSLYC